MKYGINSIPVINWLSISLIGGIFLASFFSPAIWVGVWVILSLVIIVYLFHSDSLVKAVGLLLVALVMGMLLYWIKQVYVDSDRLSIYREQQVTVEGVIYEDPDRRDDYTNYRLRVSKLKVESEWQLLKGTVLVRGERYPEYHYGDVVQLGGEMTEPPVWEDFSYKDYLARQGIHNLMMDAKDIEVVRTGQGNRLIGLVLSVKHTIENKINQLWHEPESSLLAGLLLGVRRGFSEDFQQALKKTGTTHIIAISGYNISIIVLVLQKMMQRSMARKKQLGIFTVGIILFVLLVGASASVVRAALMGWLVLLASHYGRMSRVTTSLLVACAAMMIVDPFTLWDLGFQLSFLATGGIIWVYPLVGESKWYGEILKTLKHESIKTLNHKNKKTEKQKSESLLAWGKEKLVKIMQVIWLYFWETLMVTLAAQILVLPLLLYNFGQISLISPLVNLFVLFPIPWAMLAGFVAVLGGVIHQILALPFTLLTYLPLHYMVEIIKLFAEVPAAMISVGNISIWLMMGWYLLVACVIVIVNKKGK